MFWHTERNMCSDLPGLGNGGRADRNGEGAKRNGEGADRNGVEQTGMDREQTGMERAHQKRSFSQPIKKL